MKIPLRHAFPVAVAAIALSILFGCASPGSPDGGPYDELPPQVIGSMLQFGALNSKDTKIDIFFNEFVKIENASEKVVVSPPQINLPEISSTGRKIRVKLLDSLQKNTTYTIDFSDAIVDNNEGNPLGHYNFVFSTGDHADSMEVSGKVLNAENLEPIKGILVGLHSDTTDTVFQTKPLLRVARTNGSGEFIIKGVAPGRYRAYALQDADGTFTFSQKSEMIAFQTSTFQTGSYPDARPDTIWRDSTHIDSIHIIHFTHYTPDDLVLLAFLESHQERHLLKSERQTPEHIDIYFTGPSDSMPKIRGLNFDENNAFAILSSPGHDSIYYWIRDTALIHQDTLRALYTFMETDTTGLLVETSDTMEFISKIPRAKQLKLEAEERKKWEKEQEKLKKRHLPYLETMPAPTLDLSIHPGGSLAPNENIQFETKEPIEIADTSLIHLLLKQDSLFLPAPYVLERDPGSLFKYTLYAEWRPQQEYQLQIDSAAFIGIYGHASKANRARITIPNLDTYGSLFFNLPGIADTTAVVQLVSSSGRVLYAVRSHDGRAEFFFLKPTTYYARLFIDRNGNNQWDPGDFEQKLQPEEVYYYPSKIQVRALWDIEQDWDVHALPLTRQKPIEITKQKPDKEKTIQKRNAERERNKRR
ncbi:MAG: Ig-like domain-containing protein [Bacteroidaceae bacterium]|nr:Ig-like domain-containing protein [Bacteroidaceae bacterium]